MEHVLGYDPIQIGLAFLPLALGIAVMSLGVSARLIERIGARRTLVPSMALVGSASCSSGSPGTHATVSVPVAAGNRRDRYRRRARLSRRLMTLAMSTATPEDSGLVSGLVNTSQQVGGALGLSVLATLASSRADSLRAAGLTATRSLTDGYHLAFLIGMLSVAAGLALSVWLVLSPHAPLGTFRRSSRTASRSSRSGSHAAAELEAA